jgi:hypothetical protein
MGDRRFIERKEDESLVKTIDQSVKNKWSWKWMEKKVDDVPVSECIRKLSVAGRAHCLWCQCDINYASQGFKALQHCSTAKHKSRLATRRTNYRLPGEMAGPSRSDDRPHGLHPMFKKALNQAPPPTPVQPSVPVADRMVNQEAMVLGFLAEKSLPFTLAPSIVELSKSLASDSKALNALSLDRNTASYKMRFGLGKTLSDDLANELCDCFFH